MTKQDKDFQVKSFQLTDIKTVEEDGEFVIKGYANLKNVTDSHGETCVSADGSPVYDLSRFNANPIIFCDHYYDVQHVIGKAILREETEKGLYVEIKLMKEPVSEAQKSAIQLLKEELISGLSIGGRWQYDANIQDIIRKAYIYEISVVGLPSNQQSLIGMTKAKKETEMEDEKDKEEQIVEVISETIDEVIKDVVEGVAETVEEVIKDVTEAAQEVADILNEGEKTMNEDQIKELITSEAKKLVAEEMKTINISTGKFEQKDEKTEDRKALANLMTAMVKNDNASINAISKEIEAATKSTNRSDSSAAGGLLIPTTISAEILKNAYEKSVMLQLGKRIVVSGESHELPVMSNVAVSWIANQDTEISASEPTFTNPSIAMKRIGLYSNISNTLIDQKMGIVDQFIDSYGNAYAEWIDENLVVANITYNSDLLDGVVFQANASLLTKINLSALTMDNIITMLNTASIYSNGLTFLSNGKIYNQLATQKVSPSGDTYVFPGAVFGQTFAPMGQKYVVNQKILETLNVSGDRKTTGTESALILFDPSNLVMAVSDSLRIDTSVHARFTYDQTMLRGVARCGWTLPQSGRCIVLPIDVVS